VQISVRRNKCKGPSRLAINMKAVKAAADGGCCICSAFLIFCYEVGNMDVVGDRKGDIFALYWHLDDNKLELLECESGQSIRVFCTPGMYFRSNKVYLLTPIQSIRAPGVDCLLPTSWPLASVLMAICESRQDGSRNVFLVINVVALESTSDFPLNCFT
jgi:hypothetical protein